MPASMLRLSALASATALRLVDGTLDTLEPWQFVERFCFTPTPKGAANPSEAAKKRFGYFQFEVSRRRPRSRAAPVPRCSAHT